jgi:hypothetical protein
LTCADEIDFVVVNAYVAQQRIVHFLARKWRSAAAWRASLIIVLIAANAVRIADGFVSGSHAWRNDSGKKLGDWFHSANVLVIVARAQDGRPDSATDTVQTQTGGRALAANVNRVIDLVLGLARDGQILL